MKFFLYSRGGKDATLALGDMAASMKSYKINESVEEARQMKDPKKDVMVVKKGKVIVIDKGKEKEYLKKGWELAEESLDEKNVPTNPSLWAKFKAQAKAKFDVYPRLRKWPAKVYRQQVVVGRKSLLTTTHPSHSKS